MPIVLINDQRTASLWLVKIKQKVKLHKCKCVYCYRQYTHISEEHFQEVIQEDIYQLYQQLSCNSPSNKTNLYQQQNTSFQKSDHPLDTLAGW